MFVKIVFAFTYCVAAIVCSKLRIVVLFFLPCVQAEKCRHWLPAISKTYSVMFQTGYAFINIS